MLFVKTIVAGLAGTALMSLLMTVFHRSGWANADMIRALGSLVTRSYDNALKPGLLIHFTSGALFAFPYCAILGGTGVGSPAATVGIGALIGFVHGFAMSFILVAVISEKHPVEQFRNAGFEVALAHVVGHIAYGIGVAAVAAVLAIDFGFRF